MAGTILGVSWLHGTVKAVTVRGGVAACTWGCPGPVKDTGELAAALQEAIRATGFRGRDVVMVLAHRHLIFHLQDTPPGEKRIVQRLLQRAIAQHGFYDEPAAWIHHALPSGKGRQRFLLALLPGSMVAGLTAACQASGVRLASLVPWTAVLARQLHELPIEPNDPVILAADFGETCCLLVGHGDGQVFFGRSVSMDGPPDPDRLGQELNRTRLFARQQFGLDVSQVWAVDEDARQKLAGLHGRDGVAVQSSPLALGPFDFAREAASLPARHPQNFVGHADAKSQRWRPLAACAAAVFMASIALAVTVETSVRAREHQAADLARQQEALGARQSRVLTLRKEIRGLENFLRFTVPTNTPPVAALFVRHLGAVWPEKLTLTGLQLSRSDTNWIVRLDGTSDETQGAMRSEVEALERSLTASVFQVQIRDSTARRLLQAPETVGGSAARRVRSQPFFIEGTVP